MRNAKLWCSLTVALFVISTFAFVTVNGQSTEYVNYVINKDGSVDPASSAITHTGNNYTLTQDITGSVTILRDDAVFDGDGHTVSGNAIKGTYNLDDSALYLEAGVNLTKAWNVTVQNVRVENCVNGISLINAYYCRILGCTVTENAVDGIKICWSANNMIFWNVIVSNVDDAIQLINAEHNNIMVNYLDSGVYYRVNGNGVQINGNCSLNKIAGNTISEFDTGIFMESASTSNMSANIVSFNNISNNKWNGAYISGTKNIVTNNNFYANGLISVGDNNCSGNYWSTIASIYDLSPLNAPVDINMLPEFMSISEQNISPIYTSKSQFMGDMTPLHPIATSTPSEPDSSEDDPLPTLPPTSPTSSPNPTQTTTESSADLSIVVIVIAIVSVVALAAITLGLKQRVKNKK